MRKEERGLFDKNRARVTPSEGGKNNSNSFFVIGYDSKDLLNKKISNWRKLANTLKDPEERGWGHSMPPPSRWHAVFPAPETKMGKDLCPKKFEAQEERHWGRPVPLREPGGRFSLVLTGASRVSKNQFVETKPLRE